MTSTNSHPKWWQLYLLFPIIIVLFVLEHRLNISTRGHEVAQIGILVLVYGLIYWWLKANSGALSREDQQVYGRVMVLQVPEEEDRNPALFQFPDSEIKGVLSDTFGMNTSAAKFLPIENISEEFKKE